MDWTIPLIITHIIPYILLPGIMIIFYLRRDYYEESVFSNILIQLGLISLILSMVFEFSWHALVQAWNYTNTYHVLNLLMYFFMNLGFALMSMGFLREKWTDITLIIIIGITPVAYLVGIKPIIWIGQLIALIIFTIRAYQVLKDPLTFLFPVFSFGVNMLFIFLLFATNDPLYHILHDILGTLLGLGIFGLVVWINPTRTKNN